MSFASSEERAAFEVFNRFVEAGNQVLRDPAVIARLGNVACELDEILNTAFMPNLRHGVFVAPEFQRNCDNLAVVPLTDEQADNAYEVTAPLDTEFPVRIWSPQEAATSARYGLALPEELEALSQSGPEGTAKTPVKGLRPKTLARTQTQWGREPEPDGRYWIKRPKLLIRRSLLLGPPEASGAVMAHELVHASDLMEDGPLYATPLYGGASELRAYHVGAEVYRITGVDGLEAEDSKWLDSLREQEIGHTDWPFTPNQALMDAMRASGKI